MDAEPVVASWSGGKDCCFACYRAMQEGYRITRLFTMVSRDSGRCCFHGLKNEIMDRQAQAIGFPLTRRAVGTDMADYEAEFKKAVSEFKAGGITGMVFGDIYLADRENWVNRVCGEMGITPIEPLWKEAPEKAMSDFIEAGFKAVIVSCKADVLGKEHIGRLLDNALLEELIEKDLCPCGENGEFHTLVTDGPIFKQKLDLASNGAVFKKGFWDHWAMDVTDCRLTDKEERDG